MGLTNIKQGLLGLFHGSILYLSLLLSYLTLSLFLLPNQIKSLFYRLVSNICLIFCFSIVLMIKSICNFLCSNFYRFQFFLSNKVLMAFRPCLKGMIQMISSILCKLICLYRHNLYIFYRFYLSIFFLSRTIFYIQVNSIAREFLLYLKVIDEPCSRMIVSYSLSSAFLQLLHNFRNRISTYIEVFFYSIFRLHKGLIVERIFCLSFQ